MDSREVKIRVRAYEIWRRQGRNGDPADHWREAEHELKAQEAADTLQGRSGATVEETPPVEAAEALELAGNSPGKSKPSHRSSKG
ncbi:DUF2934 domain-containing protein [Microvirga makkahensis]|uniref:DUF2934 domain-containing protein n=1 Tax=Microvirga makkahensis TaxID=1128670 RepID=UPI0031B5BF42